jgi:hypothetical protein
VISLATTASALEYTYLPTQDDRHQIAACIETEGDDRPAIRDCVFARAQVLTAPMIGIKSWSADPSQVEVMMRRAAVMCGMLDDPNASLQRAQKACLDRESPHIVVAIIHALADYAQ